MESKAFYKSRTLWVNFVAIVAIIVNSLWGIELDTETQAVAVTALLALVNIVLRVITKQPIS